MQENIEYSLAPRLHLKEKFLVQASCNSKVETQRTGTSNSQPMLETKFSCQRKYLDK
jgi:hypothetical protein